MFTKTEKIAATDRYEVQYSNNPADIVSLQNKTVTENGTVTADEGYDALSTVNVNVSGGSSGNTTAYAWKVQDDSAIIWTDFNIAPSADELSNHSVMTINGVNSFEISAFDVHFIDPYTKVSDSEFNIIPRGGTISYIRDSDDDFTLWPSY